MKKDDMAVVSAVGSTMKNSSGSACTPHLVQVLAVKGKLELKKIKSEGFVGSFLIKNLSDGDVLFKTRTNATKLFQAYPVYGHLGPTRSSVAVAVRAFDRDSLPLDGRERFQVQALKIPADYSEKVFSAGFSAQILGQLWKEISGKVNVESHHLAVINRSDGESEIDSACSLETSAAISDTEYSQLKGLFSGSSSDVQKLTRQVTTLVESIQIKDKLIEKLKEQLDPTQNTSESTTSKNCPHEQSNTALSVEQPQCEIETTVLQEKCTGTLQLKVDDIKPSGNFNRILQKDLTKSPMNEDTIFPVRFALRRSVHRVHMRKGLNSSQAFYGCFNCPVDFGQQILPVSISLFSNPDMQYVLHVCFPKQHPDSDIDIGCCLFQIRFLDVNNQPVQAHSFQFNAKQGTCTVNPAYHTNGPPFHVPTFSSKLSISWNDFQRGNCLAQEVIGNPNSINRSILGFYINVDTEVMFLKNVTDVSECKKAVFPTSFSCKLGKLLNDSSDSGPSFNHRVILKCGTNCMDVFVFFRQLLKEYSPVIELLGKEIEIARTDNPVEVDVPYVSKDAMKLFYEYVHGRDRGTWLNNAAVNVQLLTLAISLFIPDLAQVCVRNLLKIPDLMCNLEDVMAMLQTSRKLNLKCLEDRGLRWMEMKMSAHQEKIPQL